MSATPPVVTPQRPDRLSIVHFLGWMVGVGAVLAIYRVAFDETEYPEWALFMRLQQLGFGLAYGTAIGGLGLFLWRWSRGVGVGPSQPGHWLLVFGGVGLIIDLGLGGTIMLVLDWSGTGIKPNYFGAFLTHQVIGWWLGSQIGLYVLARMSGASRWWTVATICMVLVLIVNAVTCNVALIGFASGATGAWIWQLPLMVRIGGSLGAAAVLIAAALCDWRWAKGRDWLHWGGVVALAGLGLVDFVTSWISLRR